MIVTNYVARGLVAPPIAGSPSAGRCEQASLIVDPAERLQLAGMEPLQEDDAGMTGSAEECRS